MGLKQLLPKRARPWLRRAKRSFFDILTRPNLYNLRSPHRVGVVYTAPSDMKIEERLMLYSFVRGFQPQRALEIGVFRGGSGLIIANAMQDNGKGVVIGIDPDPLIDVRRSAFHGRYRLIRSTSPEALPQARELAGGPFDFVLIDGLHLYKQVSRDIEGVLPYLQDNAYVMFHDAFHYGVGAAISDAVAANPLLRDCGFLCRTPRLGYDPLTPYNGVRLLRYASKAEKPDQAVSPFYEAEGKIAPPAGADVFNHDQWYCSHLTPCPRCVESAAKH